MGNIFYFDDLMIKFITTILKFDKQGEKTGWTYIEIPAILAEQLLPGSKKSFRVKGKLDEHTIQQVRLQGIPSILC